MKVMAQIAMVMNLDKCIGCHTCSVTCKQAWTNREGTEYMWFNNVETRPSRIRKSFIGALSDHRIHYGCRLACRSLPPA